MKAVHRLRTWPEAFQAVLDGAKRHEVRKADRDYRRGDGVILVEWDPKRGEHTGREIAFDIGTITGPGEWGLPNNLCVFTLLPEAT